MDHEALGKPVIDNYWQTETGWPILCDGARCGGHPISSVPGCARLRLRPAHLPRGRHRVRPPTRRASSASCRRCRRAVCPPSGATTSASSAPTFQPVQVTAGVLLLRLGHRDDEGYHNILGRTDDVINVAGHRLGTREIEEACRRTPASPRSRWSASDQLKGQLPMAFAVVKDPSQDRNRKRAAWRRRS
jgi:propionyl-CoA synthetase